MPIKAFIAIKIPPDIQKQLARLQKKLNRADAKVKWVESYNIHLTTKFLGSIDDGDVPGICKVMKSVAKETAPFQLQVRGIGSFPKDGMPRVVWTGFTGDLEPIRTMVEKLETGIAEAVYIRPEGRGYHPHLTLGRVKSTTNADALLAEINKYEPVDLGLVNADSMTLYMSERSARGSIYTPMAEMKFEG